MCCFVENPLLTVYVLISKEYPAINVCLKKKEDKYDTKCSYSKGVARLATHYFLQYPTQR